MSSEDSPTHEEAPLIINKTTGKGKLIVAILIAFVLGGLIAFEILAVTEASNGPEGKATTELPVGEYRIIQPFGISPGGYVYVLLAHGDPSDPSNFRLHRLPAELTLVYLDLCSGCILKVYDEDDGFLTVEIWPPPGQDRPVPIPPTPPPVFDSI